MKNNLILSILILLTGCSGNKEQPQVEGDKTTVEVQTLIAQKFPNEIILSGNIEGKTTVKLGFMVSGKVEYISNNEGESIKKGQLLSQLEPTNYAIAKQLSDVQLNLAKDEFDRLTLMYKKGSVSESDYSKATFAMQQAHLQQQLQDKNLSDTRLHAPLTGVLLRRLAEVGEVVSAGTPLFVVADINKVIVSAFIPESELQQITIGQSTTISIAALNKLCIGKVIEVGAIADEASRAFLVKIEIENTDLKIRPGMIAEARITVNNDEESLFVPIECIVHESDNKCHLYVTDKNQQKAFKRRVSLGRLIENKIQIVSGLSAGETIVTAGQSKLSDGAHIIVLK